MFYRSDASLDSQVVLWLADDNPRLGQHARNRIENADTVYVSAATIWELTIKKMLGKLDLPDAFDSRPRRAGNHLPLGDGRARRGNSKSSPNSFGMIPSIACSSLKHLRSGATSSRPTGSLLTTTYPFVVDATR